MKRIAFDARLLTDGVQHGIARYAYEFLRSLKESSFQIFIFLSLDFSRSREFKNSQFKFIYTKNSWMSLGEQLGIPYLLWKYKIDLYHSPSFMVPLFCPCPFILSLHDLNHLIRSQDYSFFHKLYYKGVIYFQTRLAARVVTVSQFSKTEILQHYGSNLDSKTRVLYNGIESFDLGEHLREHVKRKLSLPKTFYFCLSNGKKHKNIENLLLAYQKVETDIALVVAGPLFDSSVKNFLDPEKFIFLEPLTEEELFSCYALTEGFLFPSYYEGFGLPALEALSMGARVLSSRQTAMPEVLENHVEYFEALDVEGLCKSLSRFLTENARNSSSEVAKRKAHGRSFSWEALAKGLESLYTELLK